MPAGQSIYIYVCMYTIYVYVYIFVFVFVVKVRMVWGSFLIAAAALRTPARYGHNAHGVNLTFPFCFLGAAGHCESTRPGVGAAT